MDPEPEGNPINNDNHLRTPEDPSPIILLRAKFIQNLPMDKDLVALVDSGSLHTMINRSALPYELKRLGDQPKGQQQPTVS